MYPLCRFFFRPQGEKRTYKRRKSTTLPFVLSEVEGQARSSLRKSYSILLRQRAVMARYHYGEEHTYQSDDIVADDYRRREPDSPPDRRDSLMQRRLRAARG